MTTCYAEPNGQLRPQQPSEENRIIARSNKVMLEWMKLSALFAITAIAEIVGCYLPWLVIKQAKPVWLLVPGGISLMLFAWLLTLHPTAAGRTYAAYGGMYIAIALLWLRFVDGVQLSRWDVAGGIIALVGMSVIALQPRM
jgi:small multidrug resistance family-3 protein